MRNPSTLAFLPAALLLAACPPAAWLPPTGQAPGWVLTRPLRQFPAADLWKYLDGDAERYRRAGVRRTLTAEYRNGAVEAVADLHCMASPQAAAALFDAEPSQGSRPLPVGDAGRTFGQSLTFHRGPFFVRLVAFQDTPRTGPALLALAHAIDSRLPR